MTSLSRGFLKSPLGAIQLEVENGKIRRLTLCAKEELSLADIDQAVVSELTPAEKQLGRYFAGTLHDFDLAIDFTGYSDFAVAVLQALQRVPYGTTVSYGELAALAGRPGAARAVGRVVGANRTPILIPCHRVIGSTGKLVGFSATGGLETKSWLLEFEQEFKV